MAFVKEQERSKGPIKQLRRSRLDIVIAKTGEMMISTDEKIWLDGDCLGIQTIAYSKY